MGTPVQEVERHRSRVGGWVVAARTHVGKVRHELQDAWFAGPVSHQGQPNVPCFAVFDGLGGLPFGREAAWAGAEAVPESAAHASTAEGVLRRLHEHVRPTQGATTAVVAMFPRRDAQGSGFLLSAGDSAAFVMRDGRVQQVNPSDRIAGTNAITSCLGEGELVVHHVPVEVEAGGVLLLCTDGVTDVLAPDGLSRVFRARDLLDALDDVLSDVLSAGAPDNATLVAARRLA